MVYSASTSRKERCLSIRYGCQRSTRGEASLEAKGYVGRRPTPKALEARGRDGGDSRGKRVRGRRERYGHRGEYRQHRRIYTIWLEARGLPSRRAKP